MAVVADKDAESEYKLLIESRPPRVVRTKEQHRRYLAAANEIVDKGEHASAAETEYLALLSVLIAAYERRRFLQTSSPADRLRELLRAHHIKPVSLCEVFGSTGTVYEVLSGKPTISKRAAKLRRDVLGPGRDLYLKHLDGFSLRRALARPFPGLAGLPCAGRW